jgi:hypothetical protein
MPGKLKMGFVVAICLIALPAIALAAAPKRPKTGNWRLSSSGAFTVSRDQKSVTKFHLTDGNCGFGKLTVTTKLGVRAITEGGVTDWVVGSADPNRTSPYDAHGVIGQRVFFTSNHKKIRGRLEIIFADGGTPSNHIADGDLIANGCDVYFTARH